MFLTLFKLDTVDKKIVYWDIGCSMAFCLYALSRFNNIENMSD